MIRESCVECPFKSIKVGPKGNINASLVIVGETPGDMEIQNGIPFCGPSGELLHNVIPNDDRIYVTNTCQCKPSGKTPAKITKAINSCHPGLLEEIKAHPRKLIIALGNWALWSLTGNHNYRITQEHGNLIPSDLAELGILVCYHPAYVLRGGGSLDHFNRVLRHGYKLAGLDRSQEETTPHIEYVEGHIEPNVEVITNEDELSRACEQISRLPLVAADIETSGFDYLVNRELCLGVATAVDHCFVFPEDFARHEKIAELSKSRDTKWTWHNGKFDLSFMWDQAPEMRVDEDTMLLSYALNERAGFHDLEQVASLYLHIPNYKDMLNAYLPSKDASYEVIPPEVLWRYNALDTCATLRLQKVLNDLVTKDAALNKLYYRTLIPASELLTHVERRGFYVNEDIRSAMESKLAVEYLEAQAELDRQVAVASNGKWVSLNVNAPHDVKDVLNTYFGMRLASTKKEILEKKQHIPIVKTILTLRKIGKLQSTYVAGLSKNIHIDGRVHPVFNIHGTVTGRLSSKLPNMQNIPRRPDIKDIFGAAPGLRLRAPDLNQAELRSLAMLSHDEFLCSIYKANNRSLHKEVAKDRYGIDYSADQLIRAKAVNFGIVYGRSAYSLGIEFDIPTSEAQADIDAWWNRSPGAKVFVDKCRAAPLKNQVMVTPFGRKRRYGFVSPETRNAVQNEAANFPHQSIASDINLHAAMKSRPILKTWDTYIVDLVHDETVTEGPNDLELDRSVGELFQKCVNETVEEFLDTDIPFLTEMKKGVRWGTLEK